MPPAHHDEDDRPEHTEEQGRDHPGHGEVKVSQEVDPDPGQTPEPDLLEDADHGVGLVPGCQGDGLPRPLLVTIHDVTHSPSEDGCRQLRMASVVTVCQCTCGLQAVPCRREVVTADCAGSAPLSAVAPQPQVRPQGCSDAG